MTLDTSPETWAAIRRNACPDCAGPLERDWTCEVKRSHGGYCNNSNPADMETCEACGNDRPARDAEGEAADWRAVAASFVLVAFGMGYAVPQDLARWADETAPREGHPITDLRAALASRPPDAGSGETIDESDVATAGVFARMCDTGNWPWASDAHRLLSKLMSHLPSAPTAGAGTPATEPDQ